MMTRFGLGCWLFCCGFIFAVANDDDANEHTKSTKNNDPVITSFRLENDDLYDENNKLKTFLLVYPLDRPPALLFEAPGHGYRHFAVTGDALDTVFPNYRDHDDDDDDNDWMVACLDKGTDRSVAGHIFAEKYYYSKSRLVEKTMTTEEQRDDFHWWFGMNCHQAELCIANFYDQRARLNVYWVNHMTDQAEYQLSVQYGIRGTTCFTTYIGHAFEIIATSATSSSPQQGSQQQQQQVLLDEFTVEHTLVKSYGAGAAGKEALLAQYDSLEKRINETLRSEWDRKNVVQRTFSSLGFAKGQLPANVFASMGSFFYNNRFEKATEDWMGHGVYVNWWESNVYKVMLPFELRKNWQARLADLVSTWAGVSVEQTLMYGLRQYEEHARLLPHVDLLATHAISLIVNVAQGGLEEPWPIEILDHAGRLHEIILKPGEIVYYESAKNLHARTRPLKGKNAYYVNLFTHYRPLGDGNYWHQKVVRTDDDDSAPLPILEVEGDCRLKSIPTTAESSTGRLGMVQQVHCDDPRLGPYISPTLFRVESFEDMVEWWYRRTPSSSREEQ